MGKSRHDGNSVSTQTGFKNLLGFLLVLCLLTGLTIASIISPIPWEDLGSGSYLGLFIVSMLSGMIAFAPGPAHGLMFSAGRVLNPVLVGFIGGTGVALGEIVTYLFGLSGLSF